VYEAGCFAVVAAAIAVVTAAVAAAKVEAMTRTAAVLYGLYQAQRVSSNHTLALPGIFCLAGIIN